MKISINEKKLLGINGFGRIGKLSIWYHLISRNFDGVVVNVGREVGQSLEDLIQVIRTDSTYGSIHHFLNGYTNKKCNIDIVDREKGIVSIDGFIVKFLREERNPKNINWRDENVRLVVDCTGKFLDPANTNHEKGCLMGHLVAGAQKVITSAPFKIKNASSDDQDNYPTMIYGINHESYNPLHHHIISAASCTTTGLAHMIKPLLEDKETANVLTASLSTVHAATNTQSVLDSVPSSGAKDLRKNRSVLNNIILSSTGAAKTLEKVIPQIKSFGFMADSIRIPTTSVSLIALNITFNSRLNENGVPYINADYIKNIYKTAAQGAQKDLLYFSSKQNVSLDLLGYPAAIVIEGNEIHTRTGFLTINTDILASLGIINIQEANIPVTHAKIMGWYDNEYGSYVNSLGKLTEYVASNIE
ncbi:MAG TPA: glyceraldehyde 3-phosphate dehydrogenase NAD-binding domain-containing protein [Bacteroidales bacterium]|nr:glyceraldehyde 3-phosphate dehydrogenase NAD-binding domain-containing protein [Bacteroidales bacterium]HQH19087.1 glyceraldehyde 3-phosphate dehydrogenase NAD-binding domain-containing protein [Bacteroidales bacterium]HQI45211.1 glyceraldehyde 3-phosphate dehydrogenase NAD-binding domain-containing protein [Bacteroidales bacterium]